MTLRCKFCGRKAIGGPCRWPVRTFVPTVYGEIKEGDLIGPFIPSPHQRPPAEVLTYKRFPCYPGEDPPSIVAISLMIRSGVAKRFMDIHVLATSRVRVEIPTYCNADTCERHQRELAPKKLVCADHWKSWEQIA